MSEHGSRTAKQKSNLPLAGASLKLAITIGDAIKACNAAEEKRDTAREVFVGTRRVLADLLLGAHALHPGVEAFGKFIDHVAGAPKLRQCFNLMRMAKGGPVVAEKMKAENALANREYRERVKQKRETVSASRDAQTSNVVPFNHATAQSSSELERIKTQVRNTFARLNAEDRREFFAFVAGLNDPEQKRGHVMSLPYTVEAIDAAEAKDFILRYEYLGTVGRPRARYGARDAAGKLAVVALFGAPSATLGAETIVLERGASAPWAHPNTASWFIPKACEQAAQDHGWKVFYAYADPDAGEIGTVYQACNWFYLGQSETRWLRGRPRLRDYFRESTTGLVLSERGFRHRGLTLADVDRGAWERIWKQPKHTYCWFADKHDRRGMSSLPYPKRENVANGEREAMALSDATNQTTLGGHDNAA